MIRSAHLAVFPSPLRNRALASSAGCRAFAGNEYDAPPVGALHVRKKQTGKPDSAQDVYLKKISPKLGIDGSMYTHMERVSSPVPPPAHRSSARQPDYGNHAITAANFD